MLFMYRMRAQANTTSHIFLCARWMLRETLRCADPPHRDLAIGSWGIGLGTAQTIQYRLLRMAERLRTSHRLALQPRHPTHSLILCRQISAVAKIAPARDSRLPI